MQLNTATTIHRTLAERAERSAQPFIVFSDDGDLGAAALLGRAERIAARLGGAGIGRGARLAILAPTGPELLAGLIAGWRLGAIICPVEAFQPAEGVGRILRQFRPALALCRADLAAPETAAILARACPVLDLAEAAASPAQPLPPDEIAADDPALCLYTSGSTGTPKGVLHSHRTLLCGAANVVAAKRIAPEDKVLCVLPLSHINGLVTTFLTPLASGSSAVYLQGPFAAERALRLIDEHACTWFSAIPTHYAWMMKPPVDPARWSLRSLRFCRSAAAPLSLRLKREFEAHYRVPIIETMGMTETAGQIFSNPLEGGAPAGSVGRPVGFRVRLVNSTGRPCAEGETGELQFAGSAQMLGYLDAPEETARIVDAEGWLRSGDLGRRDAAGFYFITGRVKDIAIFSGVNISLRAVESAVVEAGAAEEIACIGEPDELFGEKVVGYAVACAGADLPEAAAAIAARLAGLLPSPQALKEVRMVSALPRAGVGKVLKGRLKELPLLFSSRRTLPREARRLVAEILRLPEAAVTDELGLGLGAGWDSLGHVSLVLAVEELLGRALEPHEIVAATSVRGIGQILAGTLRPEDVDAEEVAAGDGALDAAAERDSARRERRDLVAMMRFNRLLPEDTSVPRPPAGRPGGPIGRAEIAGALREAGLAAGDIVLVHSDIAALGPTTAGFDREAVLALYLAAFRDVLTDAGTLAVCTSFEDYGRYGVPFIREESPSRLGAFSEYVRTRPGAVRSMHPILSVTALGPRAEEICGGNHFDAFGYDSPWGRLHRAGARLMSLGMAKYPTIGITFVHYIEHLYGVPYQYTKLYTVPVFAAGREIPGPFTMSVRYLDFDITYDTNPFRDLLLETGDARRVALGADAIYCTDTERMLARGIECLSRDRYFFLRGKPRFRAGEIPQDGPTGVMQDAYDRGAG